MHCTYQKPLSMMLIQGTGDGKSTLPQTVGVVTYGVSLIIENTLCLGAYQQSKFKNAVKMNSSVKAFQLESYTSDEDIRILINLLTTLPADTNVSFFIYSSPEKYYLQLEILF